MPKLGSVLDCAQLETRNERVHQLSAAPSSPVTGQLYYNTVSNTLFWWNGTSWVSAAGGGASDATTSSKGIIQLAGDLAGTAAAPTVATAKAVPTYGTSFPGSPVDGACHVLVDSTTAPTWQFLFRYNASSTSTYKWECIGGGSIHIEGNPAVGWQSLSTVAGWNYWNNANGIKAVPRAGQYLVHASAAMSYISAAGQMQLAILNATTGGVFGRRDTHLDATDNWAALMTSGGPITCAANDSLGCGYSGAQNYTVNQNSCDIWPLRCS